MKFARAATRRPRLISCDSSFHGVTLGPLSLVGDDFFKEGFGPLLPGCERVPFGDLDRLEARAAQAGRGRLHRRADPGPDGDACRRRAICRPRRSCAGATGRCSCSTRSRPGWAAPAAGSRSSTGDSSPTSCSSARRSAAATCRSRRWSRRREIYQQAVGHARALLRAPVDLRAQPPVDGGRPGDAARSSSATAWSSTPRASARVLRDGLAELSERYEMIKEVRGQRPDDRDRAAARRARASARLNWRLIHMASEGLFPQLIVIPLHRDHGVITMAAGKNDVIKLLPPLTLSEARGATASSPRSTRCSPTATAARARTGRVVRDIATRDAPAPRRHDERPGRSPGAAPRNAHRARARRGASAWSPARPGSSAATSRSGWSRRATRCAAWCARAATPRCWTSSSVELAVGDLTEPRSLARAVAGCRLRVPLRRARLRLGHRRRRSRESTSAGTRNLLEAAVGASVQRFIHFSTTDVYGYPGRRRRSTRATRPTRLRNWYAQTKLDAEAEVRRAARRRHGLETVILRPATVYGPGSADVVGEIARAIRGGNMLLIDGGRAVAGLCYVENLLDAALLALRHDAAPGQRLQRQRRPATSPGGSSPTASPTASAARRSRWSMPYWLASGLGFSLEHGYRLLRRTTGLTHAAAALPPGRAGARPQPGLQQPQGARDPRLGAARRLRGRPGGDARLAHVQSVKRRATAGLAIP